MKWTQFIRGLDALPLQQWRLAVKPEVPEFACDLRGGDTVGVVRDQSQQKHAVVTQVVVGEALHHRVGRHHVLPVLHRVRPVVAAVARLYAVAVSEKAASKMVVDETESVLRYQRPNEPDQEAGTNTYRPHNLETQGQNSQILS